TTGPFGGPLCNRGPIYDVGDHVMKKIISRCLLVGSLLALSPVITQTQGYTPRETKEGQPVLTNAGKPASNIIFVISDQRSYRLFAGKDYSLPAIDAIARHGVTFRNHYIASAMCSPSRAAFLSGQPPQVSGVIDQMQYDFVPTLSPDLPNMGSVLKGLGYKTAFSASSEWTKKSQNPRPPATNARPPRPHVFHYSPW